MSERWWRRAAGPLRPWLRAIRHRRHRRQLEALIGAFDPASDGPGVSYLTRDFPAAPDADGARSFGGAVKMAYLQRRFPHDARRPNLLYAVSSVAHPLGDAIARCARRRGLRVVLNQNGVAYPAWFGVGWKQANVPNARLHQLADYVIYQSAFCRESAERFLGRSPAPGSIVFNAVDVDRFSPASRPAQPITLLLGGNQHHAYRYASAVHALAAISRDIPDARLVVTGHLWASDTGDARAMADALASRAGVRDRVEFVGPYTQRDAPALFRRADVFLHTQFNDACPTLVIEAMACGVPVVFNASGGTPELVGEGGIGVPVPASWDTVQTPDPQAYADAVLRVLAQREAYAVAARARAVAHFSLDGFIARHEAIFHDVLAR